MSLDDCLRRFTHVEKLRWSEKYQCSHCLKNPPSKPGGKAAVVAKAVHVFSSSTGSGGGDGHTTTNDNNDDDDNDEEEEEDSTDGISSGSNDDDDHCRQCQNPRLKVAHTCERRARSRKNCALRYSGTTHADPLCSLSRFRVFLLLLGHCIVFFLLLLFFFLLLLFLLFLLHVQLLGFLSSTVVRRDLQGDE